MSKKNNLKDFVKDLADTLREKTGTTELINPQDFSQEIMDIPTGDNTFLKKLLAGTLTEVKASDLNDVEEINYPGFSGSNNTLTKITIPEGVKLGSGGPIINLNSIEADEIVLNPGNVGGSWQGNISPKALKFNGTWEQFLEIINNGVPNNYQYPPFCMRPQKFYLKGVLTKTAIFYGNIPYNGLRGALCLENLQFQDCSDQDLIIYDNGVYDTLIKEILFPSTLKSLELRGSSLCSNQNLTKVYFPNISYNIGYSGQLARDPSLKDVNIPTTWTSIPSNLFQYDEGLLNITIPSNITSIGSGAFQYCNSLVEVCNNSSISITAGSTSNGYVGYRAKHIYKEGEEQSYLKQVGNFIFYDDGVNTPYLMKYVGDDSDIVFPNSYNGQNYIIYQRALNGKYPSSIELDTSKLDASSDHMGRGSYYKPYAIAWLFPTYWADGLGSSGLKLYESGRHFSYKSGSSSTTTTIPIPSSLETLILKGDDIVGGDIKNIIINGTTINNQAFSNGSHIENVTLNGVETIGSQAFSNCPLIKSLNIPNTVTSIGTRAFAQCYGLQNVNIPTGISTINGYTFQSCYSLFTITIPSNITSIGGYAFSGCCSLIEVVNDSSLSLTIGSSNNGYVAYYAKRIRTSNQESYIKTIQGKYLFYDDNTDNAIFLGFKNQDFQTTVPNPGNNYIIGQNLFYNSTFFKGILEFAEGLISIGTYAFYNTKNLIKVILPSTVTSLGTQCFYSSSLEEIEIDEHQTISLNSQCFVSSKLKQFTIGPNCNFNTYVFQNCTQLESVTIKDGWAKNIPNDCFQGCSKLEEVKGNDFKQIGTYAFQNCYALKDIDLINSTSIGQYAFQYCRQIEEITLGPNITSIGTRAFANCFKLKTVTIQATTPPTLSGTSAFEYTANCIFKVPSSAVSAYKQATNWTSFGSRIIGY